jgi:hypothetical protein
MRVKLMKIMCPPNKNQAAVTSTTGVGKVDDEPAGPGVSESSHKSNYTKADLPFPPGGHHRHTWQRFFRPALLSWAGSQDDPFGTNGRMHDEISQIWCRLYPDIELNDKNMSILVDVVCHYLLAQT